VEDNIPYIVLLGNSGAGKTALAHSLSGSGFEPSEATHGARSWSFKSSDGNTAVGDNQLIDPPGGTGQISEHIEGIKIAVALVVVDATQEGAVQSFKDWCEFLKKRQQDSPFKKLLVCSREDRGASLFAELKRWSEIYAFDGAYATSSKTSEGIQELRGAVLDALPKSDDKPKSEAELLIRSLAEKLCEIIARNPKELANIRWMDLEDIIATAIRALGFIVQLTSLSKDGGKDVVATCIIKDRRRTYYVEVKHWKENKPGSKHISRFLEVNIRDKTDGGLFLSSAGFTKEAYARLSDITKQRIRLGGEDKIVSLCRTFVRIKEGVWHSNRPLPDVLFEETVGASPEDP
jgi:hypothetical protein